MTRLIIPAFVALLVSGLAGSSYAENGDNGERLPNFKQLCIADDSTGFNWENGGLIRTHFIP